MSNEKKQCIEVKVTELFSLYIELKAPCSQDLIHMFPRSEIKMKIPNIWYEKSDEYRFYSDINGLEFISQKSIYDIMFIIEDYIQNRFNNIVLHGGAIAYKDMAIAFIQSRRSGKSTLIRALLANDEYKYISDDLIIYDDGKIAGVALPIRVRNKLENKINSTGQYIGEIKDEIGETRNIYVPRNEIRSEFTKLNSIILPKYVDECKNDIIELTGTEKFMSILNNVKDYSNTRELYDGLIEMAGKTKVFELRYHDIDFAEKEVMKLWKAWQKKK